MTTGRRAAVGRLGLLLGASVVFAAILAYAPVISNPFVNSDDTWLFGSPTIREFLLSKMFVPHPDRAGYMPVGYLILAGIYHVGGAQLRHFHFASLIVHAVNAGLLFLLLSSLMRIATNSSESLERGRLTCAALAAVFFAVHPINAEVVAVAPSLCDLIASFFALGSVTLYVGAVTGSQVERHRRYLISVGLALLSGLTRWTAAGLPAILLVLDAYPLRRLGRRALLEKIPYALIGVFVIAANAYTKMNPATVAGVHRPAFQPGGIVAGLVFYVWKWLVPGSYQLHYILDRPEELMGLSVASCVLLAAAVVATAVVARRRAPAALAALGVHVIAVAPVLLIRNGASTLAHNRYGYLSGMALAGAIAGGLFQVWRLQTRQRTALALIPFAILAGASVLFGAQSRALAAQWRDRSRQWADTLSTDPDAFFSFNALGEAMLRRKDYGSAVREFHEALAFDPGNEHARRRLAQYKPLLAASYLNNQGISFLRRNDLDAAVAQFKRAIAIKPDFMPPYRNLVIVLERQNRGEEAQDYVERARRIESKESQRGAPPRASSR